MPRQFEILVLSAFEGGFQPCTAMTAASALIEAGFEVSVADTYLDPLPEERLLEADLVAISLPLFDSLRSGADLAKRVRQLNPRAHIAFFGTYATINTHRLLECYGDSCIMGEWEDPLTALATQLSSNGSAPALEALPGIVQAGTPPGASKPFPQVRNHRFRVPDRRLVPPPQRYPQAHVWKLCGGRPVVGNTEVTRGCHHRCLYCSVVPVYDGRTLLVPEEVVISDVENLVAQGIGHLTFLDAEFLTARLHGVKVLRALHERFPDLTYDFTTRVDHIVENQESIREMARLGVRFITSALEFPSQKVLDALKKGLLVEQIEAGIAVLRTSGIALNPTFILFNPWVTLEDILAFDGFVDKNGLADVIDPVQYETRLHIYKGSPLLQLDSIRSLALTEHEFHFEWKHPDPRVEELYLEVLTPAEAGEFKRCCLKC
jgi:radical SAM superfamily enzyme YgiQ (UPF0313 family)